MSTTKQRRGFKGKVVLVNLHSFDPQEVERAYEENGTLYYTLENGDDMIADYVHLCEDESAAWKLYTDYVKEKTGKVLPEKI